jgi:hypothetical protein
MIPLHGISLVIQDVTSLQNYIPLTNASVRNALVISAEGLIFFFHIMCYFNYSFSPTITLVNSFIKGLAMIKCAMQIHRDCPYITWLIVDVSHCYSLLHSRFTNSSYVASFKVIRFYTNVICCFTY